MHIIKATLMHAFGHMLMSNSNKGKDMLPCTLYTTYPMVYTMKKG